ncbi:MAG: O-antigen ligase family protein [Pirellulaceae bacterium]
MTKSEQGGRSAPSGMPGEDNRSRTAWEQRSAASAWRDGTTSRGTVEPFDAGLLRVVDAGLAGLIFVAPLLMAGRHPIGRLVFIGLTCLVTIAWAVRQCLQRRPSWTWSRVEWLLLAGLAVVCLQLVPLPPSLVDRLSPSIGQLLPLWTAQADPASGFGVWSTISLSPMETRGGLVTYLAGVLLFLVVVQRIQTIDDIERLLRWVALAAIGMASLGLLQFLVGNGKFLWLYEHPSRTTYGVVKGTFANQNHFAHFLALGVGPLIWWFQRLSAGNAVESRRRPWGDDSQWRDGMSGFSPHPRGLLRFARGNRRTQCQALVVGIAVVALAGTLTFSRGGILASGLAAVVCLLVIPRAGLVSRKSLFTITALVLVVGAALALHGYEPLVRRLGTLRDSRSIEELSHGRHSLWKAHQAAIPHFPLLGTGVGTHSEVYPLYMAEYFDVVFTHGENGYLHLLLETGFVGLACLLAGIVTACGWCYRALVAPQAQALLSSPHGPTRHEQGLSAGRHRACAGALLAAVLASAMHSLGDFVWYIPACLFLTVILLACACRLAQLANAVAPHVGAALGQEHSGIEPGQPANSSRPEQRPAWQPAWNCVAIVTIAISALMLGDRIPPARGALAWEQYQKSALAANSVTSDDATLEARLRFEHAQLDQTLRHDPNNAQAHLLLTSVLLQRFELQQKTAVNPMGLSQICDAALASEFPTRESQDAWLEVAIGPPRKYLDAALGHGRRAVHLCPLQGEAYAYLAELSFLEGPQGASKESLIAQALRVRPHEGIVQFAAGKQAALAGDYERAITYWKTAFHQDRQVQAMIVQHVAPLLPASFLLSEFQPDISGLERLFHFYCNSRRMDEARHVGRQYAQTLVNNARVNPLAAIAADQWQEAQSVSVFLGLLDHAITCQQQAIRCAPHDYQKRKVLALLLVRTERYDEALVHLQWCMWRQPEDLQTSELLSQVKHKLLKSSSLSVSRLGQPAGQHRTANK